MSILSTRPAGYSLLVTCLVFLPHQLALVGTTATCSVELGVNVDPPVENEDVADALSSIKKIDAKGAGYDEAIKAIEVLNKASVQQVPLMLQGMDGANKLALNWIRGAILSVIERGGELPRKEIQTYFEDKTGSPMGRLMAFELLTDGNAELANEIVPTLVDDPSLPLRAKAIADLIEKAQDAKEMESIGMLGFALGKARDVTQVQEIAKLLGEKRVNINLNKQLGFIGKWHVVGPFDNTDEGGFDVPYGPEKDLGNIDLSATYEDTKEVDEPQEWFGKWKEYESGSSPSVINLNEVLGKVKGATAYAFAEFKSDSDQTVDVRIGTYNANKVWVNGELIISNEIYHDAFMADQFVGKAKLNKGKNQILFKVCQNEQTQVWAQEWIFNFRVCDETGKAILSSEPVQRAQ